MTDHSPRIWFDQFTKGLIIERPHPSLDDCLGGMGIEPDRRDSPPKNEDELIVWLQEGGHNIIFKRSRVRITERVVQATPNLFAVQLCCIGDDSVDKEACARAGVLVFNDPVSNGRSVAEMVLGEMICMGRRIFEAADETHRHQWEKSQHGRFELQGKTLSVIGLGRIGKQVAQLCEAFGMKIAFFDNREVAQEVGETLGWHRAATLQEAFEIGHVVTLHVSAEDYRGRANDNFIDLACLMSMGTKTEVDGPKLFINAARGVIYRAEDLVQAVKEGPIDYAMVDVFPREPKAPGEPWVNPYAEVPQIYATPHIGAATQEAQPRIARYVSNNVRAFNRHGALRDCVYSPRYSIEAPDGSRPEHILTVVHSDVRGTKKALDAAIYDAGLSNLSSVHRDFPRYGIAYDLSVLDGPLSAEQIKALADRVASETGDPTAIRSVRMIGVPE